MTRANPFGDLGDFTTKSTPKPVEPHQIERLAADNGFPSRQPVADKQAPAVAAPASTPARRRYVTGRNRQINLKASDETIARFYRLADERQVPLAELFELAVAALEEQGCVKS